MRGKKRLRDRQPRRGKTVTAKKGEGGEVSRSYARKVKGNRAQTWGGGYSRVMVNLQKKRGWATVLGMGMRRRG